jgi:hypothetical protein
MTASPLETIKVELNGQELKPGVDDSLPDLKGVPTPPGPILLPPASIIFLTVPDAHNASCR